jgi:transcriptional regulator with XRE-family HTH domain
MTNSTDFSWTEVGERIRDRRLRLGMSQQALAAAAGITQNGVFRLENGETNPQLSTLQQVAASLKCSVRDLVVGSSDKLPILAERLVRIKRVLESEDQAAIKAMDNGIETAEALLGRSGGRRGLPPLRITGEGRRSQTDDLLWMRGPHQRRSDADDQTVVQTVRKASKPFGNSGTTHETRNKRERH